MRLRRKPWARPELKACPFFVDEPLALKGSWNNAFGTPAPLYLELGCGKGGFLAQLAPAHPEINFLGLDIKSEVLGLAKRKIEAAYAAINRSVNNLLLTAYDIERLPMIFAQTDQVDRIYINFCNPWPRVRDQKHRLTHPRQLAQYRQYLRPGGQLWFKTDDEALFMDTVKYLAQENWRLEYHTKDLHASGFTPNIVTEHEKMFSKQGILIKFLIASCT